MAQVLTQRTVHPAERGSAGRRTSAPVGALREAPARARSAARPVPVSRVRAGCARAPVARPAGPGAPSAARLTVRGRLVVAVAIGLVVLAALVMFGRVVGAAADVAHSASSVAANVGASPVAQEAAETTEVVVRPGETAWRIAVRAAPGHDPRATVDRIAALNPGIDLGRLAAGQTVVVPAAAGR